MVKGVRETILEKLKQPCTVTQLKKKLEDVSSLGTISYHLKNLLDEGLILQKPLKNQQGNPVVYYLKGERKPHAKTAEELNKEEDLMVDELRLQVLSYLHENGDTNPDELFKQLEKIRNEKIDKFSGWVNEIAFEENVFQTLFSLTEEGKKYLKENAKKKTS